MRSNTDRNNRFVFDAVADDYLAGRPDWPLEVVRDVLEVDAGTGQLTAALVGEGFDVVALEPGAALRARAAERVPQAEFVDATFEEFATAERFAATFSANAWHWVDPAVSYAKAAEVSDGIVLLWNVLLPSDNEVWRRVQRALGEAPLLDAADRRTMLEEDAAGGREELGASGVFADPWWRTYERMLEFTPDRYVSFMRTMGSFAAQPDDVRAEYSDALRAVLPPEPFDVTELVYLVAARAGTA